MTKRKIKTRPRSRPPKRPTPLITASWPTPRRRPNGPRELAPGHARQLIRSHAPTTESPPATAAKKLPSHHAKKRTKSDKMSALDAAAKVLAETGEPMTCQEMIDAMAKKGYWQSPGGRTPEATLYSAILRELKVKGDESRFGKTERGKFARA